MVSHHVISYAKETIEIIDDYLNFNLTYSEARSKFSEVYRRFEMLGIDRYNSDENPSDRILADVMRQIDLFGFSVISDDARMRKYKDIISFQIGEKTTGLNFEAEKYLESEESEMLIGDVLDYGATPFDSAYVSYNKETDTWLVNIVFDRLNGVMVQDLENYILEIYNSCVSSSESVLTLCITYNVYNREAVTIVLFFVDGHFSCIAVRSENDIKACREKFESEYSSEEIDNMDRYPKEYDMLNPISEIEQIEDIGKLLDAVSKYVGIQ